MWFFLIFVAGIIAAVIIVRKRRMQREMENLPNTIQGKCAEYIANALRNELGLTVKDDPYVYKGSKYHIKRVKAEEKHVGNIYISWNYSELLMTKTSLRSFGQRAEGLDGSTYAYSEVPKGVPIFFGYSESKETGDTEAIFMKRVVKQQEWYSVAKRAMDEFLAK